MTTTTTRSTPEQAASLVNDAVLQAIDHGFGHIEAEVEMIKGGKIAITVSAAKSTRVIVDNPRPRRAAP